MLITNKTVTFIDWVTLYVGVCVIFHLIIKCKQLSART